jgi:hypothetical protein
MIYKSNKIEAERYLDDIFGGEYSEGSSKEMSERIIGHFLNANYDAFSLNEIDLNNL